MNKNKRVGDEILKNKGEKFHLKIYYKIWLDKNIKNTLELDEIWKNTYGKINKRVYHNIYTILIREVV